MRHDVIVGDVPITKEYSEMIGSDANGTDAIAAVRECAALIEKRE
jgi:methanogenic corrinoid protein MtbC1